MLSEVKIVLRGNIYWYFGSGEKCNLILPNYLEVLVPHKQGHRSNANTKLAPDFIKWFNEEIEKKGLACGRHGWPKHANGNIEQLVEPLKKHKC